ncbi:hypothetical protein DFH07DRAFT_979421, partial [Mycena maculata]
HRFPLLDKRGREWGLLTFDSGARSAQSTLLFYEDDIMHGSLEMGTEKNDSLRSVTVKVAGAVVAGPLVDDRTVFWKLSSSLWTRKNSPPEIGRHVWPFAFPIPSEVTNSGSPANFKLPESFLERHTRITVLYEISVIVTRGMFRTENHFKTHVRYVPCTRPAPPSALRQRAYRLNQALPGPREDPDGWYTNGTAMAHGHVFRTRQAVVQCTAINLSPHYNIDNPFQLCYTRGSVIPCWITLESGDVEALDLFAAPDALVVHLRRFVRHQTTSLVANQTGPTQSFTTLAPAAWWPKPEHDTTYTRTLEGEIRVPADSVSSSATGQFSISYAVELFSPDSVGFTCTDSSALVSLPISIATMHATNAPRPVAYAPPSYDVFTPR